MNDFDKQVNNIGRQRAIAFFLPRLVVVVVAIIVAACFIARG